MIWLEEAIVHLQHYVKCWMLLYKNIQFLKHEIFLNDYITPSSFNTRNHMIMKKLHCRFLAEYVRRTSEYTSGTVYNVCLCSIEITYMYQNENFSENTWLYLYSKNGMDPFFYQKEASFIWGKGGAIWPWKLDNYKCIANYDRRKPTWFDKTLYSVAIYWIPTICNYHIKRLSINMWLYDLSEWKKPDRLCEERGLQSFWKSRGIWSLNSVLLQMNGSV